MTDDDEVTRSFLRATLEGAGCSVEEANSVRQMLDKLEQRAFDLILLDLSMPGMTGFEFLRARSFDEELRTIPVVVISASGEKSQIEKALALGATQFLVKPVHSAMLIQKIQLLFYAKNKFSYVFANDSSPGVTAKIEGKVTRISNENASVESGVKLELGKPLEISLSDFSKNGGSPLVARVDTNIMEVRNGGLEQLVSFAGLDAEIMERLQNWINSI